MCHVIKFQDFPVDREPEFHVGGIYELCVAIERIVFIANITILISMVDTLIDSRKE